MPQTEIPLPMGYLKQLWSRGHHLGIRPGETVTFTVYYANNSGASARNYDFSKAKISFHTATAQSGFAGGVMGAGSTNFGTITVEGRTLREGEKVALRRDGTARGSLRARAPARRGRGLGLDLLARGTPGSRTRSTSPSRST